jgi:hypothetical protein
MNKFNIMIESIDSIDASFKGDEVVMDFCVCYNLQQT